MSLIISAEVAAALAGSAASLLAPRIADVARQAIKIRRKLREAKLAEASEFRAALQLADTNRIRHYLQTKIGDFTVEEYARNEHVRQVVDAILTRAEEFAGPLGEVERPPEVALAATIGPEDSDLQAAHNALQEQQVVSALALMRMAVEGRLRAVAEEHNFALKGTEGAGRLLTLLAAAGLIPPTAEHQLRYSVGIANKALHGTPISFGQAEEALRSADFGLKGLQQGGA